MSIAAVIYTRSSPDCPLSAEAQTDLLGAVAADRGWRVTDIFSDCPTSTRKGRDKRSGEAALLAAIRAGAVERVLVCGIDRVGRSLDELVGFLETCRLAGVALWCEREQLDTARSNGLSLFDLAAMMAFHRHQSRRDRILRGQAVARAASVRFGRPPIPAAKVEKAKAFLMSGNGVRQAARLAGISPASVTRLKASVEAGL
jgi:DNA invertase Pin-like site-specific DNA recombinase